MCVCESMVRVCVWYVRVYICERGVYLCVGVYAGCHTGF